MSKSAFLKGVGQFERKFQTIEGDANQPLFLSSRVNALSCGIKISALFDRQTDGQRDGQNYEFQDRASIAASRGKNDDDEYVSK